MPIREYACPSGHLSEIIDISNKTRVPWVPCQVCGARAERVPISMSHSQAGHGPRESRVSRAITRVQTAAATKKL